MMLEHWEERLRRGPLPPVLLLFGEEELLLKEAFQELRARLERQDPVGLNVETVEAESITARELVERAQVYPVLAEVRAIFVRQAEHLLGRSESTVAALVDYLRHPQPTTILVFVAETVPESLRGISRQLRNPKQQKRAHQLLQRAPVLWRLLLKEHAWVEFPKLYDREVPSWVAQRARRYGYELSPPALEALVSLVGTDLRELSNELQKLAIVAQSTGASVLEEEHVLQLVGLSRAFSVFELQKALGEGRLQQALQIAQYLVRSQRQELLVIAMLTRYFLMLWKLADLEGTNATSEAIAEALGIHPFFVAEYQAAYRRFGPVGVERALVALHRADVALKTGEAPPEAVISELIMRCVGTLEQHS
ncbi:MAG: DNA polymerase III subunit delta [Candidatus Kapabacteria bacterium]|nr:DNA polymerase III subunit delta [Candidatus Kapabacteria bacterium]MDW8012757.1 DNA polymerase III subunit delta [Bacteroidota bacterium]